MTLSFVLHCDAAVDEWSTCSAAIGVRLDSDEPVLPPGWTRPAPGRHICPFHSS